jgi:hypothetical protein
MLHRCSIVSSKPERVVQIQGVVVPNSVPGAGPKAPSVYQDNMAQGADAPPMKSLVAHRLVQAGSCCATEDHWCVVGPAGYFGAPDHEWVTSVRNGRGKEAIGVVGDPYGLLGCLQVFRLVERLSQLDRALFVVSPTHDRISLT